MHGDGTAHRAERSRDGQPAGATAGHDCAFGSAHIRASNSGASIPISRISGMAAILPRVNETSRSAHGPIPAVAR